MIIVDKALAARAAEGRPIRVGIVGSGVMSKALTRQIFRKVPGMKVVAIAARRIEPATEAFTLAGYGAPVVAENKAAIEKAIAAGQPVVTQDTVAMAQASGVDVLVEATGTFEFAAHPVAAAIEAGKHIVLVNAELDGTVGPLLKARADKAGVCYTGADGDQPGVQMNLARHVQGMGMKVVLCGNIKGLQDRYRTPETQRAFAEKWGLQPYMVTSFADGAKISFEQAVIANAMGMGVAQRGMVGPDFSRGDVTQPLRPVEDVMPFLAPYIDPKGPGIVDYVVGARPGPGVFVMAIEEDPQDKKHLAYMKMGDGPYYCFYVPYHLCHLEVPSSIARAVLLNDSTLAPKGAPTVGVIAGAKKDLAAGEIIDQVGGFATYGMCENYGVIERERLLPIGLAEGCRLVRPVAKDAVITRDDVEIPKGRLIDALYAEQSALFAASPLLSKVA
jgi:predicted homoserine dehydrogenase-like protein